MVSILIWADLGPQMTLRPLESHVIVFGLLRDLLGDIINHFNYLLISLIIR